MIGPIALCISWILLRIEGKGLGELGFNSARTRGRQFLMGLLAAGGAAAAQQLVLSIASGVPWKLNSEMDVAQFLQGIRVNTNSVLYEEFLFRGYLLYQAIRWIGAKRGVLLGGAVFGIYHWFSYGIIGNPVAMAYIFLLTGAFGAMLGLAFAKTKSIAAPIGLHLGWNMVTNLGFSGGPFGAGVFVPANGAQNMEVPGILGLAVTLALPISFVVVTCWCLLRGKAKSDAV